MACYPQSQDTKAVDAKPVLFLIFFFLERQLLVFFLHVQQNQMYASSSLSPCFI